MSKYCSNCGAELNDDVKFCEYCGNQVSGGGTATPAAAKTEAKDKPDEYFDNYYDRVSQPPTDASAQGFNYFAPATPTAEQVKKNSLLKTARSWAIFILVMSILRFFVELIGVSDVTEIQELLREYSSDIPASEILVFSNFINLFYAELVVILLLFAISIVIMVYADNMRKENYQLTEKTANGMFVASLIYSVVMLVFFVVEILGIVAIDRLYTMINEPADYAVTLGISFAVSALMLAGSIICAVYPRRAIINEHRQSSNI